MKRKNGMTNKIGTAKKMRRISLSGTTNKSGRISPIGKTNLIGTTKTIKIGMTSPIGRTSLIGTTTKSGMLPTKLDLVANKVSLSLVTITKLVLVIKKTNTAMTS